jgi:hypothetical protein
MIRASGRRRNADGSISEHDEQTNLFNWAIRVRDEYPQLDLMFAIPNAGIMLSKLPRNYAFAITKYMKSEGQKSGIPDIFLPAPVGGYHGLFIEMKSAKGSPQANQKEWIAALEKQGYQAIVCKGFEAAKLAIINYLEGNS